MDGVARLAVYTTQELSDVSYSFTVNTLFFLHLHVFMPPRVRATSCSFGSLSDPSHIGSWPLHHLKMTKSVTSVQDAL